MKTHKLKAWQNLLTIFLLAGVLLLTAIPLGYHAREKIENQFSMQDQTQLRIASGRISAFFSNTQAMCQYIKTDPTLSEKLLTLQTSSNLYDRVLAADAIRKYLSSFLNNYDAIEFMLIKTDEHLFRGGYALISHPIDEAFSTSEEIRLHPPKNAIPFHAQTPDAFADTFHYSFSIRRGETRLADVCVSLNSRAIVDALGKNPAFLLTDSSTAPLLCDESVLEKIQPLFAALSETGQPVQLRHTALYRSDISEEDLQVLYCHDRAIFRKYLLRFWGCVLLALFAALVPCVFFSVLLRHQLTRPVEALLQELERYSDTIKQGKHPIRSKFSMRDKLFYRLLLTVMMPALCSLLVFTGSMKGLFQSVCDHTHETSTAYLCNVAAETLREKLRPIAHISVNSSVLDLPSLSKSQLTTSTQREKLSELDRIFRENVILGTRSDPAAIYHADGTLYTASSLGALSLPEDYFKSHVPMTWFRETTLTGENQLSYYREMVSFVSKEPIGYCKLDCNPAEIMILLSRYESRLTSCEIRDAANAAVCSMMTADAPSRSSFYQKPIASTGLSIRAAYEQDSVYTNLPALCTCYALVLLLLLFALSAPLAKPLGRISMAMSCWQIGDVDRVLEENFRIDEYNDIAAHFNRMTSQIEALIDEILISNLSREKIEAQKNKAEILALQAQINPHFLSNTIETIIVTMQDGQITLAREMLHNLSKLFRYGISKTSSYVVIREEILYAKAYANIMHRRYQDLAFTWDIDPAVLNFPVIKLVLQPIIENAIYHGFRSKSLTGVIRIRCAKEAEEIVMTVSDNGAGMTSERLAEVQEFLKDSADSDRIGLCNVSNRLRLTYGEEYGLSIESTLGEGTSVTIRIPAK